MFKWVCVLVFRAGSSVCVWIWMTSTSGWSLRRRDAGWRAWSLLMNMRLAVEMCYKVILLINDKQNRMTLHISVCPQEWHQKCSHYFILTASRGSLMAQALLTHAPGSYHFISLLKTLFLQVCMCFVAKVVMFVCFWCLLFASVSPVPSICPSWSPTVLSVQTMPVCIEGLGMASTFVSPGQVLLTGGSSRGGRGPVTRILLRGQEGWRSVSVEPSVDLGERVLLSVVVFAPPLHLDRICKKNYKLG